MLKWWCRPASIGRTSSDWKIADETFGPKTHFKMKKKIETATRPHTRIRSTITSHNWIFVAFSFSQNGFSARIQVLPSGKWQSFLHIVLPHSEVKLKRNWHPLILSLSHFEVKTANGPTQRRTKPKWNDTRKISNDVRLTSTDTRRRN